jgi:hypothetical protein
MNASPIFDCPKTAKIGLALALTLFCVKLSAKALKIALWPIFTLFAALYRGFFRDYFSRLGGLE